MKIALVSPYDFAYPSGVCNHISCLESRFSEMGHQVRIVAPASKAVQNLRERLISIGKPRSLPVSGSIARITLSPWLGSRVSEMLKKEKFDIVHLHEPLMPMLCTTVLRLSEAPNVGTFHASGGKPWYNIGTPVGKIYLEKWYNKLDGKIAVSAVARDYAHKYFPGDYTVIPNGIDPRHFSPNASPREEFLDGKLNILFVGRLEKRKGLDYLLNAYRQVKQEIPNSRLIIVGPGLRLRHQYEKQVKQHEIKDVVFVGYASYDDLPRYYKTADVVCLPATGRESFGIVLLEAMAVGKPIVASDIEGYASVLSDGEEGFLVPPKDVKKLTQALIKLMADESLRRQMGGRGRLKAFEYDWEHIAQRVMNYYRLVRGDTPHPEKPPEFKTVIAGLS